MNYTVKYLKVITDVIQAESVQEAAVLAARRVYREENTRVLSIEVIVVGEPIPPKNPTPFDRPPSGTPGAGQMRTDTSFVELVGQRLAA
jgi:hypothetical protein